MPVHCECWARLCRTCHAPLTKEAGSTLDLRWKLGQTDRGVKAAHTHLGITMTHRIVRALLFSAPALLFASNGCVPSFADQIAALADGGTAITVSFEMHLERFDTMTGKFQTLPAPPTKRNSFTVESSGGRVIVFGGLDANGTYVSAVDVYDPMVGRWTKGAPWKGAHMAYSAKIGDTVCLFGGAAGRDAHLSRDVDCYDVLTDTWTSKTPVPEDVGGGLYPAVWGGRVWLLGSTKFDSQDLVTPLATAYSFDPVADKWTKVSAPPSSRGGAGVVPYDQKLYVIAGFSKPSEKTAEPDSKMLVYDPLADTWKTGAQMPSRGIGFGLDALSSGPVAYFGMMPPVLHRYDVSRDLWTAGKEPPRDIDAGVYTSVVLGGNLYMLVLVDRVHSNRTDSSGKLWKYDAKKDEWAIVGARSPDNRDALFFGSVIGDSIFYTGVFTTVHLSPVVRPDASALDAGAATDARASGSDGGADAGL